jgi:hypothetical protein
VIPPPAGIEFCAIHLFSRCTCISGRDDRIVFIDNDCAKIAPQAGALVGTPYCQVQKIMMPVGSHSKVYREADIKEAWFVAVLQYFHCAQGTFF